jgi:hypothetical protein
VQRKRRTPLDKDPLFGGVYPNVLIGAVLIANCLILGSFETREFHSKRAILPLS